MHQFGNFLPQTNKNSQHMMQKPQWLPPLSGVESWLPYRRNGVPEAKILGFGWCCRRFALGGQVKLLIGWF
jgi:hypothetical protein